MTSGTIFASRKLTFVDLLGAICLFVNASKGLSAVQLSRDLDVQHKTAFVLMHKLREAMTAETREARLDGEVEIDGAAFGGHVRPVNLREQRIDRRRLGNRSGKRRVVVVLRQRGGRTLTRTFLREAQGVDFARERVVAGSVVSADEAAHWDLLDPDFDMQRINHSEAYSRGGAHTNLAESYFSRLRRMIVSDGVDAPTTRCTCPLAVPPVSHQRKRRRQMVKWSIPAASNLEGLTVRRPCGRSGGSGATRWREGALDFS